MHGFLFQVGAADQFVDIQFEHLAGGIATDVFEGFDHPGLYHVGEFFQVHVVDFVLGLVAVHVYFVAGQFGGQFDVAAALADGEAHLIGIEVDCRALALVVEFDVADLRRRQAALDVQRHVGGVVDDVDVLVAQFADDAVDAAALHTHAGAHRIDAFVVAFHGDFGAFAGQANDVLYDDDAILDFRHLGGQQFFQKFGIGAAEHDVGYVIAHLDFADDTFQHITLTVVVAFDHFQARQHQLVAGRIVEHQDLFFHDLVHLAEHHFADPLAVFAENLVFFELHDPRNEGLTGGHNGAPAEVVDGELFVALVAHGQALIDHVRLADADLRQFAGDLAVGNDFAHPPDFQVAFGGVDNDVEIVVGAVLLLDEGAEYVFQHAHHGGAIYVFAGLKIGEDIY